MTTPLRTQHFALANLSSVFGRKELRSEEDGMSSRKCSGKLTANEDVRNYRTWFRLRWKHFIQENYESPAHVAFVWKVDPTTAKAWWEGTNAPQGWASARALTDPQTQESAIRILAGSSPCEGIAAE